MKIKKHNRMILCVCLMTVVLTACGTSSPKEHHDSGKQGNPSGVTSVEAPDGDEEGYVTSVETPDGDEEDYVGTENTDDRSDSGYGTSGSSETANTAQKKSDSVNDKTESGGSGFRITEDTENKYGEFRN